MFWSDFLKNKEVFHIASKKQEICEKTRFVFVHMNSIKIILHVNTLFVQFSFRWCKIAQLFRRY